MTARLHLGLLALLSGALALALRHAWERTHRAELVGFVQPQASIEGQPIGVDGHLTGSVSPSQSKPSHNPYLARAQDLRTRAMRDGYVSYLDVVLSAYDPGVITPQVLATKARYRKRLSGKHRFLADYSEMRTRIRVVEGTTVRDPLMGASVVGMFDPQDELAIIGETAAPTVLYHEIGHAIQKSSTYLDVLGEAATFRAMREGRLADDEERWLRYIVGQNELEVAMQDLNRRWAASPLRKPILTPEDAVAALIHGYVPLEFAEVSAAFGAEGQTLTEEQFRVLFIGARRPQPVPLGFRDASNLSYVHALAGRVSSDYRIGMLQRVIFEAPGHL